MERNTTEKEKSTLEMTPEELDAWLKEVDEEPEPTPFACFNLATNEGRCAFLEEYILFGEVRLFEAVAHMWARLCEPKKLRCIGIGIAAGTGGTGKWALAKFLRRALRETLDYDGRQPWDREYSTVDEFHEAAMGYFAADHAHYVRTIQKYADLLVGEPGRHSPMKARLIVGPWPQTATPDKSASQKFPIDSQILS